MNRATSSVITVRLVRHGETRTYADDVGLTPRGVVQAYRRGIALAEACGAEGVRILTARAHRARETAEQLRRGLLEGSADDVPAPEEREEFDNFRVLTPQGRGEVTAAHRDYLGALERHERDGVGPRPGWLVDVDRFWRTQQAGGDPIRFWLTVPLLHFEPPALCVRRFWRGIMRLLAEQPAAHVIVATHSGPIRAFAAAALGHDAGEPLNAEEVVVRVDPSGGSATVTYRNHVQQVRVADVEPPVAW